MENIEKTPVNGTTKAPLTAMPLIAGVVAESQAAESPEPTTPKKTGLLGKATRTKTTRKVRKVIQRGASSLRRMQRTEWFRTRPGWAASVYILEDQNETYVIGEDVAEELGDRCFEATLHGAINLFGDVFLIPVKSSDHQSAASLAEAIETAETEWVQSYWMKGESLYSCDTPADPVDEPIWPKRSWEDIFEASVKSRFIDSLDHEVIQRVLNART